VQIGDENVHRVRSLMDEVFGEQNFISCIFFQKTGGLTPKAISNIGDYILWYGKNKKVAKYRQIFSYSPSPPENDSYYVWLQLPNNTCRRMTPQERRGEINIPECSRIFRHGPLSSSGASSTEQPLNFQKSMFYPSKGNHWKTASEDLEKVGRCGHLFMMGNNPAWKLFWDYSPGRRITNVWLDTQSGGFNESGIYVVQTTVKVVERCLMMATDPGDLVLDPTCGSGTAATVAEQWGRRWITIDTSRVALALARSRIMGARYPFYLLADSREGQQKESELTRTVPSTQAVHGNIRHGFVYERVPHITLKSIANNAEIDVIWERWQEKLEPLRAELNAVMDKAWEEWDIPRDAEDPWDKDTAKNFQSLRTEQDKGEKCDPAKVAKWLMVINQNLKRKYDLDTLPDRPVDPWSEEPARIHEEWWNARIALQKEIDASIAAKAEFEYLYDKPYEDKKTVRVAGPFTVESLSPHRVLGVDENDELIDSVADGRVGGIGAQDFTTMILENLRTAGVQQAHKDDRIVFTALTPWPGDLICAEGLYFEGGTDDPETSTAGPTRRAAIFIGPEFGTVSRPDLVAAAREAGDADYDVLIACAFNFDAHSTEFEKLGRIPVLKARMNADLHMADDLKNTGKGNLFVIFGEPDIDILDAEDEQIQVKVNGVDVFHPQTGEIRSDGPDGIACWFIDTDYNEESFFVCHAYFLGANDPYKALKTTLKAEINEDAWSTLNSDTSRPFAKPSSGRIAVKVINHLGDEVMKVFRV